MLFGRGGYPAFGVDAGESSFDIAVKHLYKVVVDCLLHLRSRHDIQARISNRMAEAEILFRCGLLQAATEELTGRKTGRSSMR